MEVILIKPKQNSNIFYSSAKNCYSDKIVLPDEEVNMNLLEQLFDSGHHTVFQHNHYCFYISGVSRYLVWALLHLHPFYNTSQVSQRYVRMDEKNVLIPKDLPSELDMIYKTAISDSFKGYKILSDAILPYIEKEYFSKFKHRKNTSEWKNAPYKISYENARYILTQSTLCHLTYTTDLITILKMKAVCDADEFGLEGKNFVNSMISEIIKNDPKIEQIINHVKPVKINSDISYNKEAAKEYSKEFDLLFKRKKYQQSIIMDYSPKKDINKYFNKVTMDFTQTLNTMPVDSNKSILELYNYTFAKKISLSCDSQLQRHRTAHRAFKPLIEQIHDDIDFYIPQIFIDSDKKDLYIDVIKKQIGYVDSYIEAGGCPYDALYLLPNSTYIRLFENISLSSFINMVRTRMCLNAQEEIRLSTFEEAEQIKNVHDEFLNSNNITLAPNCVLRYKNKIMHPCTEGKRYCGTQIWRLWEK